MSEPLIVGLDLGSSRIRIAIGHVVTSADRGMSLSIVGAVEMPSMGVSKGVVTALEDAVACISSAVEQAERQVGASIDEVIVGLNGTHISLIPAKGVVGVSRSDREIRSDDIERVMQDAKSAANPANHEILHVIPHGFTVDGQSGIQDPVGMNGIRIEANTHLILGLAGNVRNVTKCVFRTGLDIANLVFSPMAGALVVTSSRERELGVCVVNIGASMTSVLVYEDSTLLHASVLPIGSDHVTSDIAIGLRTSLEIAESLKKKYGSSVPEHFNKDEEINLKECGADADEFVSLRYISEIIQARMEEIFEKVEAELRSVDRSGMLPAGVVLTGGGAQLRGASETAKAALRLPSSIGSSGQIQASIPELVHQPSFSTAVGLVQWGFDEMRHPEVHIGGKALKMSGETMGKIGSSIKKIFKSFMP